MCSPRKSDENFSILTFLWIKTNVAYTRLQVITTQCSALQVEFITGVKLICYFVLYYCFLQWDHLPNMAVGDLAFYYTLYLCAAHQKGRGDFAGSQFWGFFIFLTFFYFFFIYLFFIHLSLELVGEKKQKEQAKIQFEISNQRSGLQTKILK